MKSSSRRYRIGFALVFSIFLYWLVLSIPGDPTVAVRGHNRTRNNQVGEPHLTRGPISAFAEASVSSSDPEASEKVRKAYRRLPLRFERNLGQLDESVKFVHRGARYTLLLKATAAEMILDRATTSRSINDFKRKTLTDKYPSAKETTPTLLRMSLIGSDPEARVSGIGELASKTHYFAGSDPKRWRTNIPAYGRVLCEQVYPGIDLIYYGNQSRLEYDFEVAPGSDPESILWKIDGAETTEIDSAGDVVIRTQNGPVRLDKPKIYQESEGIRHPVSGRYVKRGESHIGFEIDSYDASLALTIDPVIQYATYLGGGGIDIPWSIVLDSAGAALITGQTSSLNFPTSSGAFQPAAGGGFDVFVTKLNPSGTALDYSTYIGGSASDGGTSILVDGTGSAYVTGFTFSANFPTAGGPFQANKSAERDAFLLKLDSNGNLVQSGFFGGAGADEAWDTAMDASGNVYIAGRTTSTDLPTTSGAFQPMNRSGSGGITNFFIEGFVACFDSSGQLQAGTYVGGNGQDEMFGVEVDSNNQIAVAGFSSSTDLITTSFQSSNQGGFDALFYLLDQQLGLVYGTYLGGEDNDWAYDVATDFFGNAFIFGETRSLNFPTTPNAYQAYNAGMMDVFVAQFGTDPRSGGSPAQNGDIVFRYGTLVGSPPDDFSNNITARSFEFGPAPGGPTLITFAGQTDHVGSFPTRSAGAGLRSSGSGWFFAINNEDHFTINVIDSPPGTVPGDFTVNPDKNTIHFVDGQGSQVVQLEYAISGDSVEVDVTASNNIFLAEPRHIDRLSMDGLLIADGSQGEWVRMSDSDANDRWVYPGPVKPIGIRTSGTNIGVVATKNFSFWDAGPARETPIRLNVGQEAESNTFFRNAIAYDATNLYVELQERDGSWAIDRYTLMNDGSGSFIESDRVLETGEPIDNSTFGIAGFGHRVAAAFSNHVQFAEVFSNGTAFVDTPGGPVQLCGMLGDQAIMTWDRDMSGTFDIVLVDPLFPDDFIPAGEFPPGVVPICSDLVDLDLDGDLDLVGEVQGPPGSFIATMNFPGEGDPELKTSIPITGDGRGAFPSIYVDTTQGPDTNDLGFGVAYSNEVAAVWTEATDMFTSPSTFQTGLVGVSDAHITLFSRDLTEFGTVFNFSYEHLDPGLSEESRPEDGVAQGTDQFTGYAVANLGTTTGPAVFTAMDTAGTLITGPNITNPAKRTSNPGEQLPIVDTQLFGSGFTDSSRVAWVEVKSTLAKLTGFFLTFNSNLTFLDGADASIAKLTAFVFPEIEDEGFNDLRVANPCPLPTDLTFQLLQSDGKLRTTPVTRRINARGVLAGSFTDLFPGVSPVGSDYLLVAATRGVVPFQLLGKSEAFVHALNGQDYTGGSTTLYCPQYVIGGADWRTTLSVVNLDSKAGSITFRFFSDAGVQQGATKMMAVSPRGKLFVTDQTFFLDAGDTLTQGYLVITADVRMSGSVIFGDPARSRFSAALPLVSNLLTDIVYGQLASNDTYFMGVAVLNPGGTALTATIEVYDASGTLQFTVDVAVPAGERRSQLLTQYIPAMVGQDFSSGYVRVRLNRVGASFSLYGTNVLDVLAAVTAQAAP